MSTRPSPQRQQNQVNQQDSVSQNDIDQEFVIKSIQQQQIILKDRINEKEGELDQAKQEYLTIKNILKSSSKNLSSQQSVDITRQLEGQVAQVDQINKNIQRLINQRNELDYHIQEIETKISKSNHLYQTLYNVVDSDEDETNDRAQMYNKINELNQQLEDRYNQKEEIEELLAQSIGQTELLGEDISKLARDLDKMKLKTQQRTQYTISSNESYPPNFLKNIAKLDDQSTLDDRFKELSGIMILYEQQLNQLTQKLQDNETRKQSLSSHKKNGQQYETKNIYQRFLPSITTTVNQINKMINGQEEIIARKLLITLENAADQINPNILEAFQEFLDSIKDHLQELHNVSTNKQSQSIVGDDLLGYKHQLQKIYTSLSSNKSSKIAKDDQISFKSFHHVINKIIKKLEKKEQRIINFNNQREQFLDEFEKEATEFHKKCKDLELSKQKVQQNKDEMREEFEQEYQKIKSDKNELKNQQLQVEQILKKANYDYQNMMQQSSFSQNNYKNELKTLNDQKSQISDQIQNLRNNMQNKLERLKDLEENCMLLEEQEVAQKQRIQDQYSLSDNLTNENDSLVQNIQELQKEKIQQTKIIQDLRQQLEQYQNELDHMNHISNKEIKQLEHLKKENEIILDQKKKINLLYEEGKSSLLLMNKELRQKEIELQQFEKIQSETKIEIESLNQLKIENIKLKKETFVVVKQYDEVSRKANIIQKNLYDNKNNLDHIIAIIQEKQRELIILEDIVAKTQYEIDQSRQDNLNNLEDQDFMKGEIKKLSLEKNKIQFQLEDYQQNYETLVKEYGVQTQTSKALQKQIEKKVTELSQVTQKCQYKAEEKINQSLIAQSDMEQVQVECENKHTEFRQLVNQIQQLLTEKESISLEVDRLKDVQDQMQHDTVLNFDSFNELQIQYDQTLKQVQKLQKSEKNLNTNIDNLKNEEIFHNQRLLESEELLMELKKQHVSTLQRTKELQTQEDTIYVHQALNGIEVQGFGSDRIQYLVQCQNNLEEMEKILFQYKNELASVSAQRDRLSQILYENDVKYDIQGSNFIMDSYKSPKKLRQMNEFTSQNQKQIGFINSSRKVIGLVLDDQYQSQRKNPSSEVQQVLQNIEELNQNIDKMYQDSFQNQHDLE